MNEVKKGVRRLFELSKTKAAKKRCAAFIDAVCDILSSITQIILFQITGLGFVSDLEKKIKIDNNEERSENISDQARKIFFLKYLIFYSI